MSKKPAEGDVDMVCRKGEKVLSPTLPSERVFE